jgi:zinc-ribbon domain
LPFCLKCGMETLETDRFCPGCGRILTLTAPPISQAGALPEVSPTHSSVRPGSQKGPFLAAAANLFFPGLGYVHTGAGHNSREVIIGILLPVSPTLVFYATVINGLMSPVSSTPQVTHTLITNVGLLPFLIPVAFAYNGYQSATLGQS